MIKIDWTLFIKRLSIVIGFLIAVFLTQKYITNQVAIRTQIMQEICEKEKADIKLKLETEKINQDAEYKKQIIELKNELEKAKILLEKIEKEKKYSNMIKKDTKKFMDEIDGFFDIKGKENVKK